MKIAALFAGIGGLELGLHRAGHSTHVFCEIDPGATRVLKTRFGDIRHHKDIRSLKSLPPEIDLVTAGFPCQDLSQAGLTRGIAGSNTGLVSHVFRLLKKYDVPNVLFENVPFMLQLRRGQAIRHLVLVLEQLGYNWAYRVIDARSMGIPQRRLRVFLVASKQHLPWNVLFRRSHEPSESQYSGVESCGFYWTEGNTGLGWAVEALPAIKGGSGLGIPSPPAIWLPNGRVVTPDIRDAERLQGFRAGWTKPAEFVTKPSHRWTLVGNAVCVKASEWIGSCLKSLPEARNTGFDTFDFDEDRAWPTAAFGEANGHRAGAAVSSWPCKRQIPNLMSFLKYVPRDLSLRAVSGFIDRLTDSSLRYPAAFLHDLRDHKSRMETRDSG